MSCLTGQLEKNVKRFEKANGETEGPNQSRRRNMYVVNQHYTFYEDKPGLSG